MGFRTTRLIKGYQVENNKPFCIAPIPIPEHPDHFFEITQSFSFTCPPPPKIIDGHPMFGPHKRIHSFEIPITLAYMDKAMVESTRDTVITSIRLCFSRQDYEKYSSLIYSFLSIGVTRLDDIENDEDIWQTMDPSMRANINRYEIQHSLHYLEQRAPIYGIVGNQEPILVFGNDTVSVEMMYNIPNRQLLAFMLVYHPITLFMKLANVDASFNFTCTVKGFHSDHELPINMINNAISQSVVQLGENSELVDIQHNTWYPLHTYECITSRLTHSIVLEMENDFPTDQLDSIYYAGSDDGHESIKEGAFCVRYGVDLATEKVILAPILFIDDPTWTPTKKEQEQMESIQKLKNVPTQPYPCKTIHRNNNKIYLKIPARHSHLVLVKFLFKDPSLSITLKVKQYNILVNWFTMQQGMGIVRYCTRSRIDRSMERFGNLDLAITVTVAKAKCQSFEDAIPIDLKRRSIISFFYGLYCYVRSTRYKADAFFFLFDQEFVEVLLEQLKYKNRGSFGPRAEPVLFRNDVEGLYDAIIHPR